MAQLYVGTKIITAWEFYKDGQPGYGVKYADGHTSWSPKATFEEAYLPLGQIDHLPSFQQRVIAEKAELVSKLGKLDKFIDSEDFERLDFAAAELLRLQRHVMADYARILNIRIGAF